VDHHAEKAGKYKRMAEEHARNGNLNRQASLRKKAERHAQEAKEHHAKREAAHKHEAMAHAQAEHIAHHTNEMNRHLAAGREAEALKHQAHAAVHEHIAKNHLHNRDSAIHGKAATQVAQAPSREATLHELNAARSGALVQEHSSKAEEYAKQAQEARESKQWLHRRRADKLTAMAKLHKDHAANLQILHESNTQLVQQEKLYNERFQQKAAQRQHAMSTHHEAPRHHATPTHHETQAPVKMDHESFAIKNRRLADETNDPTKKEEYRKKAEFHEGAHKFYANKNSKAH
jgi:hypothetical protein